MTPFTQILCGVDFSDSSTRAFGVAVQLASWSGARLHVLHCIETEAPSEDALVLEEKAAAAMDALLASSAPPDVAVTSDVTAGLASVELARRAAALSADLVVVGGSGVTLLEEAVIGGTAQQALHTVRCSVLVVR